MSDPAPIDEFLAGLAPRGIELWCEGDELRVEAPDGALADQERERLRTERSEIMAALRCKAAAHVEELPLSFPQFTMWLQHQQAPESTVCVNGFAARARGPLNLSAMRHAVQGLVDRHPQLRTTYHVRNEALVQRVVGSAQATVEIIPCAGSASTAADDLPAQIARHLARPFDLEAGPLFRVVLFAVGETDHTLLVSFHHIAADSWSGQLLFSDFVTLYREAAENLRPTLTRLRVSYGDFVHWQATEMAGSAAQRLWEYWRQVLAPPRQRSVLPTDRVRPSVPRFVGDSIHSDLSSELVRRVRALASKLRTTDFVVLLAGFQVLVARLCGTRDVVTGMPSRGRPSAEFLPVVGNFLNVLPIRSRLEEATSIGEFIAKLHATVVGAKRAQHYPLPRIVQQLNLSGEETGQALFNTTFTSFRFADGALVSRGREVAGTTFSFRPLTLQAGLLDLALDVVLGQDEIYCILKYSHDALTGEAAGEVSRQYANMIAEMVDQPDEPLSRLLGVSTVAAMDAAPAAASPRPTDYWSLQLVGVPATLALPTDRPRSNGTDSEPEPISSSVYPVPRATLERLGIVGKAGDAQLFMILMAAWLVMLHRHSGQDDLVVATTTATGDAEGPGSLPIRARLEGNPSFNALLEQLRSTILAAVEHGPPPATRCHSRFDFHPGASPEPAAPRAHEYAALDLAIEVVMPPGDDPHCMVQFRYLHRLFEQDTVDRLHENFCTLLDAIVERPTDGILDLDLLGPSEQRRHLRDSAAGQTSDHDRSLCVHQLLERSARLYPERVAVSGAGGTMRYGVLDRRANQLARHLLRSGLRRGSLVAVCLERTVNIPMALAAVLKAGGAYLPLDPTHPRERLRGILRDAGVSLLVTQDGFEDIAHDTSVRVIRVDAQAAVISACSDTSPAVAVEPQDLAYVIYTSGSTGRPKGVEVEHRNLVAFLDAMRRRPGLGDTDVLLAVTTLAFDIAGLEVWLPLAVGARIVVATRADALDGARVAELLDAEAVTVMQATPATWRLLLESGWTGRSNLRALCGGEALPPPLAARLIGRVGELWNLYGPTETTIWSTAGRVGRALSEARAASIPIGRPVANTVVRIEDLAGRVVPSGVVGELLIGGEGVARGYRGDPDLTAQMFVKRSENGLTYRMYRTGDLARFRSDAQLELLGRRDHQIKLRGHRIEPGEIEALLGGHPGVTGNVVIARATTPDDERLVAYLTVEAGASLDPEALRSALRTRLPDYMVPAHFVVIPSLPLTPNGKIDRAALPPPDATNATACTVATPASPHEPMTPAEQRVASLWRSALGIARVGRDDNFFDIGGHSLLLVKIQAGLRREFGVKLPLIELFHHTTIAKQVQALETCRRAPPPMQVLEQLRSMGAELTVAGDRLKVTAATIALTPELRASIAEHKAELIALVKDPRRGVAVENPPVVPVERGGRLPLSLFQQRLWIIEQMRRADEPRFNMVTLWTMPTKDRELIRRAIIDVVSRHEILRSTFRSEHATPYVQVGSPEDVNIGVFDLRTVATADQAPRLDREVQAAITEAFDLATEPPVRWRIYVGEEDRLTVQVCADHIAMDEFSFLLLRKELDRSLASCAAGVALAEPTLQYADYAAWEKQRQASAAVAAQLDWWLKHLVNLPPFCALPPDHHGPSAASGTVSFAWDQSFTAQLRELALTQRCTLFMVLLSALSVVLRAATGNGDIVVGTPIGIRDSTDWEGMIGPFVNLVALRLDLQDDPRFSDLLARARETVLDAQDHREASFELLVERLNPVRSPEFTPLFQVQLVMHNAASEERSRIYSGGTAQTLTWYTRETAVGLMAGIEYRSDLYRQSTIERLVRQLEILLRAAIEDPSQRVSTLPLMTPDERRRITSAFNDTRASQDESPMFIQFERQVEHTPLAIALRYRGGATSYEALNRRANRIARHLRAHGAGPGARVGICLERSTDLLATLLAVAKTGAAYVPLDPLFPVERLRYMVENSELTLLVADGAPGVAIASSSRVIDLGADAPAIEAHADDNLGFVPDAMQPAYIIYTSGSTGRPNGVVVPHAALANLLGALRNEPGMTDSDVMAAVTTVSFDIAALELYLPLMVGASVVMVPRDLAADGAGLSALLIEDQVTIMQATPATWRLLLEVRWPGAKNFVALCGGESLPADLARSLSERVGVLWNLYGPTETTVWSTAGRVETGAEPITIGRPIANTQVYIVDSAGAPVPVGMPGEIWIGGAGLASGYWRNPALSAKKFLATPVAADGRSARVYRTGDLGRWREDGKIVHLGRLDHQLKLRGFRIEPGEIEVALGAHPAVREAVVVMRGGDPERARLTAYVVYRPGRNLTTTEARAHLQSVLPEYMIPSAFVTIDAVPRTPNGKIDRAALPDPYGQGRSMAASDHVAPTPGAEQLIAKIWEDVLAVERVGASDNFFDLGGHSLLGLRVAETIRERTGWRMPPYVMFQQSLRQIAASLEAHQNGQRTLE